MNRIVDQTQIEVEILEVIRLLLLENGSQRVLSLLSPTASFERDLGLGSLERVELLLRIESEFSVSLPDATIAEATTPRALAMIVQKASPSEKRQGVERLQGLKKAARIIRPARTLSEGLMRHAEADPERPHIYLTTDAGEEEMLTYRDLLIGAEAIARGLIKKGIERGETVAIMLPTGKDFFFTFCGILLAGGVPVPVYPPFRPNQIEEYAARQEEILRNAGAVYLITFQRVEKLARLLRPRLADLRAVLIPKTLMVLGADSSASLVLAREGDAGLIQYTSGSTGSPKGVLLTHENLLANIRCMKKAMAITAGDVGVSWLPLYHDMGLIGSWLFSLIHGIPIAILPPFAFLSRPEKWLWTLHRHGGTLSAAPNFAYEICAKKIRDESIEGLDLSRWRIALNGAEPVNPETLRAFSKRFAPYGFRPETHLPVYGMAEASVGLSFPPLGRVPRTDKISRDRFQRTREAFPASPSEANTLEFVSCGLALPEHELRIVDDEGQILGERVEGQIEFRGPSCTSGYYQNAQATASLFHGDWLVPGDLGYKADGELFITGRKKDLIIKGGRNLHPHEIEAVAGEVPGVRKGCVAAVGIPDPALGTEKLVVVIETRETREAGKATLNAMVNERILNAVGVPADLICLVPPGSVPKTSSGKIARSACREAYLKGRLTSGRRHVQLQFLSLCLTWFKSWALRGFKTMGRAFYGAYLVAILGALLFPAWLLVLILPAKYTGFILKQGAKLFLRLACALPRIEGFEGSENKGPMIWVANHASYLDVTFLIATLPEDLHFVSKKELLKVPFLRTVLIKGKHITVDRTNVTKGVSETQKIEALLKSGASVLIFPEGTFRATAGIRPFKLGAFKASIETEIPIIPVTLQGTREFLRGGTFLPRRMPVTLTFSEAIYPEGKDWRDVVRLRNFCRKKIAAHSKEVCLE